MISYNVDKEKELLDLFARRWKAKRLLLRSEEWKVVLEWMKEFFRQICRVSEAGWGEVV